MALKAIPLRHGMTHGDMLKTYIGLLCLGKSDFDAVENYRKDTYFRHALDIGQVPSSASLRQRLDAQAEAYLPLAYANNIDFLARAKVPITPLKTGHVPLDMDVYPMDNSDTHKEGVSRTYHGYDGYAPIGAYLGLEGWCLANELRPGSQHSQKEFTYVLERVLPNAKRLAGRTPILVRLDSAHDALETRGELAKDEVDFLIKWNPRGIDPEDFMARADELGCWEHPREGKRVAVFSETVTQVYKKKTYHFRRVIRITERTLDKHGQWMVPNIELEGWWTTLDENYDDATIIALYKDHATCEQFHSEFKTDLDLERTLMQYASVYNHQIPQKALGHRSPVQALKNWQEKRPELFKKRVYKLTGLDT
ncbi:transposase, IS1380 family [Methylomarinovum caldicuralii]|uniref:Transposase, IS1380 family n=1 Tax=Methylomarinovum caldicuralii TaxID=438856 RepID=A0AAU9C5X3_9GAMM|nr:transposase, IS1380 family [Methylomarinovum caldicuralii]